MYSHLTERSRRGRTAAVQYKIRHYKSTCDKRQNMALALEAGQVYCFPSSSSSFFLSVNSTRIQTYIDSTFIGLPHRSSHNTTLLLYFHQTGTLPHSHTPFHHPPKLPTTHYRLHSCLHPHYYIHSSTILPLPLLTSPTSPTSHPPIQNIQNGYKLSALECPSSNCLLILSRE